MTISLHGSFTSLSRDAYLSETVFERETEMVMGEQWHYIAHTSDIPNPGDFLVETYAGESVIVARDRDGGVGAFFNTCRHRGFALCQSRAGNVRKFTCPYHQWTYGLDGRLIAAPDMPNGSVINYDDWGLHRVQVEVWEGMIFICLSKAPKPSIGEAIETYAPQLRMAEPSKWKKAAEKRYPIAANWKVLLENFLECYHCKATHPELCAAMDLDGMYGDILERPIGQYSGGMVPLKPGMMTQSMDGKLVSKPLGQFANMGAPPANWGAGFQITPVLTRIIAHVDHALIFSIRPIDVGDVEWVARWFVHADAVEGVDYNLDRLMEVWLATNDQDLSLCVGTFQGMHSRRYVPGPLSALREPAINSAVQLYRSMMAAPEPGAFIEQA
ncbi:aromatic ring-hydroxylating oxygenase subunit alpha [Mesorhizobium retamae]|uniref:Aromatic ring-hydroxylating dioxygenase subunit alpha n=1 Tax=Mesorhizobium retamae TaxID=2912854 RepID=A0ABS9QF09_9HYPH|nr:aromatic ring-hydroxylating dioxygenase subunit alpha [Mesorhizobium sp. IRAMC:0171]MCG7505386.1 aromatic ring-hydroxylating dioxygenase subunit alpha [Mesorhizobium sp. IRAMC:0171]